MAVPLDKLTRYTAWVFGEAGIAYTGPILSASVPYEHQLVVARETDGSLVFDVFDPDKTPRAIALGIDREVAVGYQLTVAAESEIPNHQIDLYDDDGVLLWESVIVTNEPDPDDVNAGFIREMACDPDGNVFYVFAQFTETRFGKLSRETGSHIFLQDDFINGEPSGSNNQGCTGLCCDPDGNAILTYIHVHNGRGYRKYSPTGALLWELAGLGVTGQHWSPRCDSEGNVFVFELTPLPGTGVVKKLNGTTGQEMARSAAMGGGIGTTLSIDDDGNVWVSGSAAAAGSADVLLLRGTDLGPVPAATIFGQYAPGAGDGFVYIVRPDPATVRGYAITANGSYQVAWSESHDFDSIGDFAQRFIGDQ